MKIRIGGLELTDVSPEELDELIKRYGGTTLENVPTPAAHKQHTGSNHAGGNTAADGVVLAKLIEAGTNGVPTNVLGEILGKRGKGARGALRQWSKRVGLSSDDNLDTFEDCRSGTKRGIRLKSSFLDVAKKLSPNK